MLDYSNRLTNFFDGPLSFLFAGWTWSIRPLLVVSTVDVIRLFMSLFYSFLLYSSGVTSRWFQGANTLLMSRDSIYYYLFIFYVQTMLLGFVEGEGKKTNGNAKTRQAMKVNGWRAPFNSVWQHKKKKSRKYIFIVRYNKSRSKVFLLIGKNK